MRDEHSDSLLYLRLEVFPTAFPYKSAQYLSIYVNGVEVMKYCAPGLECGADYYACLADYDVSNFVQPAQGGTLEVQVTATGLKPSICDHNGYPLFVRMTIHDTNDPHTQAPSLPGEQQQGGGGGYASLSSFDVSYQVKPGFMLSMALWGVVGSVFGAFAARFRSDKKKAHSVVVFKWYALSDSTAPHCTGHVMNVVCDVLMLLVCDAMWCYTVLLWI